MPNKSTHRHVLNISFFTLILAFCLTAPAENTSPKTRLTVQQAISLRRLNDLQFSPDGTRLALEVTEPPQGSEQQRHIWVYFLQSDEMRQFTSSAKSEIHPRWSPDGKRLAFLSSRSDPQQIYTIPADGGEAKALTEGKRSIENFEWSPDGKQIALLAPDEKTDAEEKKEKDKDDARSVDLDAKRTHLWVADSTTGKVRLLTGAPWQFAELQWLPNSQTLVAVATDHPESDQETNRIFTVGLADGAMKPLATLRGPFYNLQVSRDGTQIAFVGSRLDGPQPHDLVTLPISGGTPRNLTATSIDRPVNRFSWRPDGKLLALVDQGFRSLFFLVDIMGHAESLRAPEMSVTDFDISADGTIAFVGGNAARPSELWTWDQKNSPQFVSHVNDAFNNIALFTPEFIHYKSFDGRDIEGALLRPAGVKTKLPTVLHIHGGPTGNWTDSFESWGQLLASAGYAVFYPTFADRPGMDSISQSSTVVTGAVPTSKM
jgi:dipeptidyl aminopeptidase/acylaminoacyl peptidase